MRDVALTASQKKFHRCTDLRLSNLRNVVLFGSGLNMYHLTLCSVYVRIYSCDVIVLLFRCVIFHLIQVKVDHGMYISVVLQLEALERWISVQIVVGLICHSAICILQFLEKKLWIFFFQHKKLHISQFIFSKNNLINISQKINELFLN